MIPLTSKVSKFRKIYQKKMARNGRCDTIVFGDVLGREKAFLIQNMCPIDDSYVLNEYLDASRAPVRIENPLEAELEKKALWALELQRKGKKVIFPDVLAIEKKLLSKHS